MTSKSSQQKTVQRKQQSTCRNCGGSFPHPGGQSACPAIGLACKSCGKPNHFAHCCFNKLRTEQDYRKHTKPRRKPNITQKVSSIQIKENSTPKDLESAATSSTDDKHVYVMQAPSNIIKMMTKQEPTNKKILPYGKQHPLPLLRKLTTDVSAYGTTTEATVYVVQGDHGSLLSHKKASELGLIHIVYSVDIVQRPTLSVSDQLMLKYPNIMKGIGKLKNIQVKLHIDDTVKSSNHIVISLSTSEKKVEKEL